MSLVAASVAVVVAIALAAVAIASRHDRHPSPATADASALYGLRWSDPRSDGSAIFRPDQVELSDGCTSTVYSLDVDGDHLKVGATGTAVRSCGGGIGPPSGAPGYDEYQRRIHALTVFQSVFASTPSWTVDGTTLTLTAPTGIRMDLAATSTVPSQLPGTNWTLQDVVTLHATGTSGAFEGPTLTFSADSTFTATDTCNTFTGTAHISTHEISFSSVQQTHNPCPPPTRPEAVETIDTMLTSTVKYALFDDSLRLTLPSTDGMLNYRVT